MDRALVADDHAVTRRGLRALLLERWPHADVIEVADGDAAAARFEGEPWDLILLDVMMPGPGVVELLCRLRALDTAEPVPVLVLTGSTEVEYVIQTLKAGANGLVHKHLAADELLQAVDTVMAGGSYLHADTAAQVARSLQRAPARLPHLELSERELEVFRLLALGRAVKEIGFALGLSEKTVATYLARIREKTGLVSHVEIARYALKNGLVE